MVGWGDLQSNKCTCTSFSHTGYTHLHTHCMHSSTLWHLQYVVMDTKISCLKVIKNCAVPLTGSCNCHTVTQGTHIHKLWHTPTLTSTLAFGPNPCSGTLTSTALVVSCSPFFNTRTVMNLGSVKDGSCSTHSRTGQLDGSSAYSQTDEEFPACKVLMKHAYLYTVLFDWLP